MTLYRKIGDEWFIPADHHLCRACDGLGYIKDGLPWYPSSAEEGADFTCDVCKGEGSIPGPVTDKDEKEIEEAVFGLTIKSFNHKDDFDWMVWACRRLLILLQEEKERHGRTQEWLERFQATAAEKTIEVERLKQQGEA